MAHTLDRLICDVHEDITASVERIIIQLMQLKAEVPNAYEAVEGLEVELSDLRDFAGESMTMGQRMEEAIKSRNIEIQELKDQVEFLEDRIL